MFEYHKKVLESNRFHGVSDYLKIGVIYLGTVYEVRFRVEYCKMGKKIYDKYYTGLNFLIVNYINIQTIEYTCTV